MKLQRYEIYGGWEGFGANKDDSGDWCLTDDVEALESEVTALHAECDRLTAMLDQSKWRCENCKHWVKGDGDPSGKCDILTRILSDDNDPIRTYSDFGCLNFEPRGI